VLRISHLYAIESLETDVTQYLLSKPLCEETLFAIYSVATSLHLEPLKLKFFDHILENGQMLLKSDYVTDLNEVSFRILWISIYTGWFYMLTNFYHR